MVLTDTAEAPYLLLDANRFLRSALSAPESDIDLVDYCVEPLVTTNPDDTLEGLLTSSKLAESHSPDRGVILLWGGQRRIVTHYDVLKRLFAGVVTPPAWKTRRAPMP